MVLFSKYKESLAISNRQEAQVTAYKLQFGEAWGLRPSLQASPHLKFYTDCASTVSSGPFLLPLLYLFLVSPQVTTTLLRVS